jgi:hypothetical protein
MESKPGFGVAGAEERLCDRKCLLHDNLLFLIEFARSLIFTLCILRRCYMRKTHLRNVDLNLLFFDLDQTNENVLAPEPDGRVQAVSKCFVERLFLFRTRLAESDLLWENAQRSFEVAFGRVKSEAFHFR